MGTDILVWCLSLVGTLIAVVVAAVVLRRRVAASPYGVDKALRCFGKELEATAPGDRSDSMSQESVCVIGAGVSGLFAAYRLGQRCRVVVLEGSPAPGGHNRSCPVASHETPVQYGCSGWWTSPLLTSLVAELGLHRIKVCQNMAALVEGQLELKRFQVRCWCRWVHFARSFPLYQQLRMTMWMGFMHFLFYLFPLQNWSAADILPSGNAGIDDIFIPACGINVFIDRCDLSRCPYTYFARYAALYLGRRFFCIREGNHELIRRLHARVAACCDVQCGCEVSRVSGEEGRFFVQLQSGATLGPFHQVIMACQPHAAADLLPADARFDDHRACLTHFDTVVAHSVVHTDPTAHVQAKDPGFELGIVYDRTLGSSPHHYLHINPARFYRIGGFPEDTFVTVGYDDARPADVVSQACISKSFRTVLSRLKVESQRELPRAIEKVHANPCGIHFANAAFLGLMWHEDGLSMAHLAQQSCVRHMRRSLSGKPDADDSSQSTSVGSGSDSSSDKATAQASLDAAV